MPDDEEAMPHLQESPESGESSKAEEVDELQR
jgi:hypothetical protein